MSLCYQNDLRKWCFFFILFSSSLYPTTLKGSRVFSSPERRAVGRAIGQAVGTCRQMIIAAAAAAACWNTGTRTVTISTGLMWYLLMSPWWAFTIVRAVSQCVSRGWKARETDGIRGHDDHSVEASTALISKYHMRPVLMVLALVPVFQHAVAVALIRSQSKPFVWMSWAISSCYLNFLCGADKDTASSSGMVMGMVLSCDWLQYMPI